ncbi:MAG: glycosyltransferase family 4 protein [Clostridium sp.]|nr:glycosyltransferase family 4 protein [Clostridium sp.]
MKLLFDLHAAQPNYSGASHGGGKYAIAVFYELIRRGAEFECVYDSRLPLRNDIKEALNINGITCHDLSKQTIDQIVENHEIDTYYSANSKSNLAKGIRNIITLHGLRGYEMPRDWWMLKYKSTSYLQFRVLVELLFDGWWRRRMLKQFRKDLLRDNLEFVVVSEHTKYSCLCNIPELEEKDIKVFYSPSTTTENFGSTEEDKDEAYVLLVSGNRCEKNALRAIAALDEIFSERPEYRRYNVIVTGAKGNEFRYRIKNKDNFKFLGYVDEGKLDSLYRNADLFLYPSINEGFGYPPLEAMRYGVPVAASPISSIHEVCGDAALYFNPFDYKEIKGRILRMFSDGDCREQYSLKGLERYKLIENRQREDLSKLVDYIFGGK